MCTSQKFLVFLVAFGFTVLARAADDVDQMMGTIHKIDLSDDSPKSPSYILTMFDVKKANVPGSRAHSILRQMRKRTRAEFEANGLPKGNYKLAISGSCPAGENGPVGETHFKKVWRELLDVKIVSAHVSVEKSHMDIDLRPGGKAKFIAQGKSLALFQKQKDGRFLRIDCKTLN